MYKHPPLGVIEGFFGRSWHWQQRLTLPSFLREQGLNFYLYAPKNDACLRRHWQQDWDSGTWDKLIKLRQRCHDNAIHFGVGLSPLALCRGDKKPNTRALIDKINRINALKPDILGLLFDDMRGDIPHLAATQAHLAQCAAEHSSAQQIILCPTYYSTDPVLEKVFGPAPEHYLRELGRALDPAIEVFWTGPQVCSEHYPREHLENIAGQLRRKPFLWDNYPVNDGAVKSQHLYLQPVDGERTGLQNLVAGHAANPMNQFYLSLPALASLPLAYRQANYRPGKVFAKLLQQCYPSATAHALARDAQLFAHLGLKGLSREQKDSLIAQYRALPGNTGAATEVIDWLEGRYTFDPACLTE